MWSLSRRFLRRQRPQSAVKPLIAGTVVKQKVLLSAAWYGPNPWDEPSVDEILIDPYLYKHATFVLHVLDAQYYLHTVYVSRDVYKYLRDRRQTQYDEHFHTDQAIGDQS